MSGSEGKLFKQLRLVLIGLATWLMGTLGSELLGNRANNTWIGQFVGNVLWVGAAVAVPVVIVGLGVVAWRARRHRRSPIADDETPPPPRLFAPPTWHEPDRVYGRRDEVAAAVRLVRDRGIVVITGERDVGTSAVGRRVAQELIDHDGVDPRATTRFDLRSRSASTPDDPLTTAGRVVSVFGIDEPADETELQKVARELVGVFRAWNGTLLLDNVNTPEQVTWLVAEWPSGGPGLVIVGEPTLVDVVANATVRVEEMSVEDMRELWRAERRPPRQKWYRKLVLRNPEPDRELDELLAACLGRPRAVRALAAEISRPGSTVEFHHLLAELRQGGQPGGAFERVWRAILANVRAGLSPDAVWLLSALAGLPVTGLIKGAVAAMLDVADPVALEELRNRNLVDHVDGRYRLPQEYRRAIEGTTSPEERHAVTARALPALLGFYREFAELWVTRLETDPKGARQWFEESEPSFRPLYAATYPDELLKSVLDDLCAIADALASWYVRARLPQSMLVVHEGLHDLALSVDWLDVAAHAAIRQSSAHRMAGAQGAPHRFGDAVQALDNARTYLEKVPNPRVREDLEVRERSERALVAIDRGTGLAEVYEDVAGLQVASPAVLINLSVLCLGRGDLSDALLNLLRAERLAKDAGDQGAQAHSVELQGVVLSHWNLVESVRFWQLARATFGRIGEKQGEARCLQHLAAAALADPRAAGQLLWGNPQPVASRDAADAALSRLQQAKSLRPRQQTPLADRYRGAAVLRLE